MAGYRNVSQYFWQDSKVVDDFEPEDRYFYLYLLTNPHTNILGCYEISFKQMMDETGLSRDKVKELIKKMQEEHKVIIYDYETKEVLIKKWSKYNWTKSDKLLIAVESVIPYVKSNSLKEKMLEILKNYKEKIGYLYGIDTSISISISNNINNILNNNNKLISIFNEYIELRKEKKLSCSKTVINDLLETLKEYDDKDKEKIIKKAIKNGWKDFYPLDAKKEKEQVIYEQV